MSEQAVVPLSIVRGTPTPEETAALVAVLLSRPVESPGGAYEAPRSAWADPAARMRQPLPVGPGAWRRSALPA
jgi:hypothetical protein